MMAMPPMGGTGTPNPFPTFSTAASPAPGSSTDPSKAKPVTPTAPGTLHGPPSGNNHSIPLSARRAEPLDFSTVERRGQGPQPDERPKENRAFGIPEAPSYRPNMEEFRDPMEYMRKIAPEASQFGIVKIIPPEGWNPTFAINTERFHFRTRRQELNSVEGGNRVNNDYLDQLAKFHKQNGHNLNRFPSVDKRPLDLYRLKKTVERKGGFDFVCKMKRWAEVGRDLGYSGKIMSSLSTSLKNSYQKWLLPYEEYLRLAKPGVHHSLELQNGGPYTPSPNTSPAKKSHPSTPMNGTDNTPAAQASAALHSTVNGHSPQPGHPAPFPQEAPPRPASGFTPVNTGGFTAVNLPTPSTSFTSVNGFNEVNGYAHSNTATPPRNIETPLSNSASQPAAAHVNGLGGVKRRHSESILSQEEIDAMNRRSKRLRKDVPTVAGSNMHHSRMSGGRVPSAKDRVNARPGEACETCGKCEDYQKFARCQSCELTFHMYCLEPPLKQMPDYEWHCPRCLVGTNEYGFEEGDVYSLSGFQRKAQEFKTHHFNSIPKQFSPFNEHKRHLTEQDVEKEFWRLVEDISDTTEVEYGADIHSTTHGSGFPTIEKQPRDPYSTDPWNLNIMPLDKESLFRHVKSDVSGMTIPWLYVGMVFSTFCWHNEDHLTYSANYQHFGQTKTWYGIPGEDTEKFEQAMREEVPEIFETQPDILFQLVTLARPEKLRNAGVRVYAIDQHAGQFVVTFPKAYHAGFNHGFNFNEAVNFAPSDWEPFGEEGVRRLRNYRKQPCFSHDELLLTAAARDHTIRTAKWLAPAMERMRDDEMGARKHFFDGADAESGISQEEAYIGARYEALPDMIDPTTEEEEIICTFCKAYCFLSRYKCHKSGKYLCLLHAGNYECCDAVELERHSGRDGTHRVLYRLTDAELYTTVRKVVDKANIPATWAAKVDSELEDNPRPSLKHLRTLLTEGEKIQYELPQLPDLRRFVERCNEWVEEATSYITRKQQGRRKSEKAGRKSAAKIAEAEERERELRKVDNIRKLLAKADEISFDCLEISTLRERAENIAEFQRDANYALNHIRSKTTADFQELAERGRDFHVDIPEIDSLERVVKRLRWDDSAKVIRPNHDTRRQDHTLQDVEGCIAEGMQMGVPETNPDLVFLREHKAQGELWETKAKELMAVEQVHYQQLDSLSQQAITLAVNPETLASVDAILKKQREVQDKIVSLLDQSRHPDFRQRPMYKEMKTVLEALEELQSKPNGTIDLEKEQKRHEDWMRKGKKLFGKANAPLHILHQHMQIVDNRNEACFDMDDQPRLLPVEPSSRQATPEEGVPVAHGSNSSRDVFCICRKPEAGMMIECGLCKEWYHGKCLKIARGKVKEDDKYTCPICDWRVKIPRDAARPKLEDLQAWQDDLEMLPFQPEEEKTLASIVDHAQEYRDYLRGLVHSEEPTASEEVNIMRFHLRKVEGADILLSEETNTLRQELHKWCPIAPEPPPLINQSGSTRKPRPTKQQKVMAQLGITNPDDLPQQYRIKPHLTKRKGSEGMMKDQSMQPVPLSASPSGSTPMHISTSSNAGPSAPKRFLTPLALQVLGSMAEAPVVSQMLETEPHMNRDKLLKMKRVLETDDSCHDDLATFQQKFSQMPMPASYAPTYNYEPAQDRSRMTSSQHRESPLFQTNPHDSGRAQDPTAPPQPLGSPATFDPYSGPHAETTPPPAFDTSMFDAPTNTSMFDSPGQESSSKAAQVPASADFGEGSSAGQANIYGALPEHGHGGATSTPPPGFDHGPVSVLDNVFADLVHDQEAVGGFDGTSEGKAGPSGAGVVQSTEAANGPPAETGTSASLAAAAEAASASVENASIVVQPESQAPQQQPQPQGPQTDNIDPNLGMDDFMHQGDA